MDVGEKIKKARKAAGLTQLELARKINMSQSYIADMERSRHNPSLAALQLIANALQVDIAEFVSNSSEIQETGITNDEVYLLQLYRSLNADDKALTVAMMSKLVPPKTRYSTSTSSPIIRTRKIAMGG
ncbi:MAG: helix-turn-helix domain-containing protein [Selenomonadaceae bacterium]|nr:helix-turn-helix domain-containing protein [Selenomonadaceae bacterium]